MLFHQMLIDSAERTPSAPCFHWVDRDRIQTYEESVAEMKHMAAILADLGVTPGDRVALVAHNGMDYLNTMFGAWYLGAISAHVNVAFKDELDYYLGDHQPTVVVYTHDVGDEIRAAAAKLESVRALVCMDGAQEGALSLPELLAEDFPVPPMATDETAIAHLSYTSGTTGQPKGACLMHEPTATATRVIGERLRITAQDRSFAPGAMSSSNPLVVNILPEIAVGAMVSVMKDWTPETGYEAVKRAGATLFIGNPMNLNELHGQAAADPAREHELSLRAVVSGGGAVPPRLRAAWARDLSIPLVESYGQSELGGFVALGFPSLRPETDLSQRIGPSLPDKEVRILDEDGTVLPLGAVGEICLRGGFMHGYWDKPEKTAATLRDGWLHTGDLGSLGHDGWVTLRSRSAETIDVDGVAWYPRDLEESLLARQDVAAAAVVKAVAGDAVTPTAAVVVAGDAAVDENELRAELEAELAMDLTALRFAILDALPMTATGKIAKATLAEQLSSH